MVRTHDGVQPTTPPLPVCALGKLGSNLPPHDAQLTPETASSTGARRLPRVLDPV